MMRGKLKKKTVKRSKATAQKQRHMGLFGKSDYDIGLKGSTEDVAARAKVDQNYDKKLNLVGGCVEAFLQGRQDNLRAFFASYLDFKRGQGKMSPDPLSMRSDGGFDNLIAAPFLGVLERQADQWRALAGLTQGLSPYYRDAVMALALRHARNTQVWPAAQAYLEKMIDIDDTGYKGPAEKVRLRAGYDSGWVAKVPLLQGCIKAHQEGNSENLGAFIGGYLALKRHNGNIEQMRTAQMDEGIRNLFTRPLVRLLEDSKDPVGTIGALLSGLNDYYREAALGFLLREAAGESNSWFVTNALLEAGADPNASGGWPLLSALFKDNPAKEDEKIITLLHRFGADFDKVPAFLSNAAGYRQRAEEWKKRLDGKPVLPPANTNAPLPSPSPAPAPVKAPKKLEL